MFVSYEILSQKVAEPRFLIKKEAISLSVTEHVECIVRFIFSLENL